MPIIKITSKRQATLPVALCETMGVAPGDTLNLEQRLVDGKPSWVIHPQRERKDWMGSLRKYASNKSHDMNDIRWSIARARKK